MVLLPSASGTVNLPPLIRVPGGDVTSVGTWHVVQPIVRENRLAGQNLRVDRAARRRFRRTHEIGERHDVDAIVLGIGHRVETQLTSRPLEVFSVGNSGLVMPISLRYASAANDSRLACWFFQPNRPMRGRAVGLEHGRERDGAAHGRGLLRRESRSSVVLAIASTKPAPSVFVEMRNVLMSSSKTTRSTMSGWVARECTSDPPSDSKNSSPMSRPVRCSAIWLAPPVATF